MATMRRAGDKGDVGGGVGEWRRAVDAATGNAYYYHRTTRETRWTPPWGVGAGASASTSTEPSPEKILATSLSKAASVLERLNAQRQPQRQQQPQQASAPENVRKPVRQPPVVGVAVAVAPPTKENAGPVPSRVREAVDPATGLTYFYDTVTRQSYWYDPRLQREPVAAPVAAAPVATIPAPQRDEPDVPHDETPTWRSSEEYTATQARMVAGEFEDDAQPLARVDPQRIRRDLRLLKRGSSSAGAVLPRVASVAREPAPAPEPQPESQPQPPLQPNQPPVAVSASASVATAPPPTSTSKTTSTTTTTTTCLRKSGCTCALCVNGGVPTDAATDSPQPATPPTQRLARSSIKGLASAAHMRASTTPASSDAKPKSKWRKQSEELRAAMRRASSSGSTPANATSADDAAAKDTPVRAATDSPALSAASPSSGSDWITCPHCERRFGEAAAERHIPKCGNVKARPKSLRKGEGRGPFIAPPSSPSNTATATAPTPGTPNGRRRSLDARASATLLPCASCGRHFSAQALERHASRCQGPRVSASAKSLAASPGLSTSLLDDAVNRAAARGRERHRVGYDAVFEGREFDEDALGVGRRFGGDDHDDDDGSWDGGAY